MFKTNQIRQLVCTLDGRMPGVAVGISEPLHQKETLPLSGGGCCSALPSAHFEANLISYRRCPKVAFFHSAGPLCLYHGPIYKCDYTGPTKTSSTTAFFQWNKGACMIFFSNLTTPVRRLTGGVIIALKNWNPCATTGGCHD